MEDSNIEPNNNQNDKENNSPKYYSFEISCEKELFSIEISTEEKEKSECIIFKAYENQMFQNIFILIDMIQNNALGTKRDGMPNAGEQRSPPSYNRLQCLCR